MATPLKLRRAGAAEREVEILAIVDSMVTTRIDGEEMSASLTMLTDGSAMLAIGDHRYRIIGHRQRNTVVVAADAMSAEFHIVEGRRGAHHGGLSSPTVDAPMPGTVLKILVAEGARVAANEALIVIEAMKTETTLSAESDAVIKRVHVQVGQRVDHGATLIELGPVPES